MGKLFQVHIIIALLCLFSFEQTVIKENTIENAAPKSSSSRTYGRIIAYNVFELTEQQRITEACSTLLDETYNYKFPILIGLVLTNCHIVTHGNIPYQTDTSPPNASSTV